MGSSALRNNLILTTTATHLILNSTSVRYLSEAYRTIHNLGSWAASVPITTVQRQSIERQRPYLIPTRSCRYRFRTSPSGNTTPWSRYPRRRHHLRKTANSQQLIVDGEPFLMVAGELHNSSLSSYDYMNTVWPTMKAMNINTVLGAVTLGDDRTRRGGIRLLRTR